MKKRSICTILAAASIICGANGAGRTNRIENAVSDWTIPSSYKDDSFVPGAGDVVVIPKDTTVLLDASNDAGSLGLINSLERIVMATPTSRMEINVDPEDEKAISISISGYKYSDDGAEGMDYTRGPIVKKGKGTLTLSSAGYFDQFLPWAYTAYDYYTHIVVEAGTLHLQPMYKGDTVRNTIGCGRITVEKDATLMLPYGTSSYGGTVRIMSLSGAGVVTNLPSAPPTLYFTGKKADGDAAIFEGQLNGNLYLRLKSSGSDAQVLAGTNSLFTTQTIVGEGQRTGIGSFGNGGAPSSLGCNSQALSWESSGGIIEYVGSGETSDRGFVIYGGASASSHPAVVDAGATGGLTFTGLWQRQYQSAAGQNLIVSGSNTSVCLLPRILDNAFSPDPNGTNHTLYLRKEGSGSWRMLDRVMSDSFHCGISVDEGSLQYDTIAPTGKVCALGMATHLTDGTIGPDDVNHGVDYAIRLGAETFRDGYRKDSACLEYIGTTNCVAIDRKIALAGNGRLRASGSGYVMLGPVSGIGSGGKTLCLDGESTLPNAVIDISDGTGGGRVSVVKEGAGKWHLGGDLSFHGDLSVRGGELVVRNSPNANYTWYRWIITGMNPGTAVYTGVQEFGLFSEDGVRQNKHLSLAISDDRTCNRMRAYNNDWFVELEPGTCAYGNDHKYGTWTSPVTDEGGASHTVHTTIERMFDCGNTYLKAGGTQLLSRNVGGVNTRTVQENPATWVGVTMRLADGSSAVTRYDIMWTGGGWNQPSSSSYVASNYFIQASLDGLKWDTIAKVEGLPLINDGNHWVSRYVQKFDDPYLPADGFKIASGPAVVPNVLGNVDVVSVSGGGKLTLAGGGAVEISSLKVDASSGGTIDGFSFSADGSVEVVNAPRGIDVVVLPVVFENAAVLDNVERWTLTVNGSATAAKRLAVSGARLVLLPRGFVFSVR